MNPNVKLSLLAAAACWAAGGSLWAGNYNVISAGGRYHVDHSVFLDLPYDDGDLAYGLAYEYHEDAALWQVAVTWAPEVNGEPAAEEVITPEINLILKDRAWRFGLGALKSYIKLDPSGSDWTDIYFQFIGGFQFPVSRLDLGLYANYVFESFSDLDEFDAKDMEFSVWLGLKF